jgi:hypothetical protein
MSLIRCFSWLFREGRRFRNRFSGFFGALKPLKRLKHCTTRGACTQLKQGVNESVGGIPKKFHSRGFNCFIPY